MADIFRKKALNEVAAPDRLDDYIKVSNPSVWLLLGAICAFLVGVGIWCVFGNIADVQPGLLRVENGVATCYLDQTHATKLGAGDRVEASGVAGTVAAVDQQPLPTSALTGDELAIINPSSSWVACATVAIDMPDGDYAVNVTVEEYKPLDLLMNRA